MASTGGTRGDPRDAQRARALLDYLLETVTIFDRDGVVVYSTGDAHGVLRYEPGTVQGRHGFDYIHPEDRDWVIDAFQRILRPRMTEARKWLKGCRPAATKTGRREFESSAGPVVARLQLLRL